MNRSMLLRHGNPGDMAGPMRPQQQEREILMPSEVPAQLFSELINMGNLEEGWVPGMATPLKDPEDRPVPDRFEMGERFGF